MQYIKNLMIAVVSAIMGTVSASLFEGWTAHEQKIVFLVSVLMLAVMLTKSSGPTKGKRMNKPRKGSSRKRKARGGKKQKGRGP